MWKEKPDNGMFLRQTSHHKTQTVQLYFFSDSSIQSKQEIAALLSVVIMVRSLPVCTSLQLVFILQDMLKYHIN